MSQNIPLKQSVPLGKISGNSATIVVEEEKKNEPAPENSFTRNQMSIPVKKEPESASK